MFVDYHPVIDGVDYRKSIFIFLSNTGGRVLLIQHWLKTEGTILSTKVLLEKSKTTKNSYLASYRQLWESSIEKSYLEAIKCRKCYYFINF